MTTVPSRLHPDRGWWAKYDRAEKHLDELKTAITPFIASREHLVTAEVKGKKRQVEWVYRVHVNGSPDPAWGLIVGDFLFDLQAALDHIAVALNPRGRKNDLIYFPIYVNDPWRRQTGRYVERDPTNRKVFTNSTRDMLPVARTLIKSAQPYIRARATGNLAEHHLLVWLKRLHVTDKHRRLLVIARGSRGGHLTWTTPSGQAMRETYVFPPDRMALDGAPIKTLPHKVDMKFVGPLGVAVTRSPERLHKVGGTPYFDAVRLAQIQGAVRDILTDLEPHIQW